MMFLLPQDPLLTTLYSISSATMNLDGDPNIRSNGSGNTSIGGLVVNAVVS